MTNGGHPAIPWHQVLGIPLNVALFVFLMLVGWGVVGGFFAHPARSGALVIFALMTPVMTWCTGGRSRGLRDAADWKPFFPLLVAHTLFTAYFMPYMDARGIFVLPESHALRWTGFGLLAVGGALRIGPMLALRHRFSAAVAIQRDHALHTSGFYAMVRHPSYLGILFMDLGLAGVFRSVIALALLPVVFWMFKRRMDVEERLLVDEFGDAYRGYVGRTARLVPGIY